MKRSTLHWILVCVSLLVAAVVAAVRWRYESAMPELVPTDAQNGIWIVYSAAVAIGTFVMCFAFLCTALLLFSAGKKYRIEGVVALCAFLFVAGCTGNTLRGHSDARQALEDSANPATSPERLRALIGYQSGFGYEVDNRIAKHPNATEDILRVLSRKTGQTGTLLILVRNPNTPEDVILEIAESPNQWVQDALKERAGKRQ